MNEADTRAELIDPKLKEDGWDNKKDPDVKILREYIIAPGKIMATGRRGEMIKADYVLTYKNRKLAVVEAKSDECEVGEGVAQAKNYGLRLELDHAYATNGIGIYYMNLENGKEGDVDSYHSPTKLFDLSLPETNDWQKRFDDIPAETKGGTMGGRFYQEIAVERVLDAIAKKKNRILLTLATGTGKTWIAFEIAWKLFQTRWNLKYDGSRRPRILFLADRNILANQAFNAFSAFPEDALVRIKPGEIKKKGAVPTNGSIFFTIFQTFMSGPNDSPYFGKYPPDYFDLVIVDECHRGGANDESTWREILEYFKPAVQLGLTATPKRDVNIDTYKYFGNPVYTYSLKEGINDGYLTPFKVKRIKTSLDQYTYSSDDKVIEGDIEEGKTYTETDFNKIIEIRKREQNRVRLFMSMINQKEKTLVFCANQEHAAAVRELINQRKNNPDPLYCVRVTANDGDLGETYLKQFQDNEQSLPTILTTSQKLSTGVDARNIRNIVLMRPIKSMVEFKQIIGRGTRLFDGKNFFTIYDFTNASEHFRDDEWDGPAESIELTDPEDQEKKRTTVNDPDPGDNNEESTKLKPKKIKIQLATGKEEEITYTVESTFFGPDGNPITLQEFLTLLYGKIPEFFKSEAELRKLWSDPKTRIALLQRIESAGFSMDDLQTLQRIVDAEDSDLFDVLEFLVYSVKPVPRLNRVATAQSEIFRGLNADQKDFIDFVLNQYVDCGVEELQLEQLPHLLELKYGSVFDAADRLGTPDSIRQLFIGFQKELYQIRTL